MHLSYEIFRFAFRSILNLVVWRKRNKSKRIEIGRWWMSIEYIKLLLSLGMHFLPSVKRWHNHFYNRSRYKISKIAFIWIEMTLTIAMYIFQCLTNIPEGSSLERLTYLRIPFICNFILQIAFIISMQSIIKYAFNYDVKKMVNNKLE